MSQQVVFINLRPLWARTPLLLLAAAALWVAWQGARYGIGGTLSESAPVSFQTDPAEAIESAEAAVRFAPRDPQTHLMLARINQATFDPQAVRYALRAYGEAAALAPNDYLVWMEVGRARSALGDPEGGVAALRRATELAPNYAAPRWHLGNALLRAGRADEAFAELRRASDADPKTYQAQVFNMAWQVYGPNVGRVVEAVGKTTPARAQLVAVLAGRGLLEDASAVWEGLGEGGRRAHPEVGQTLARAFYAGGRYGRAVRVLKESGAEDLGVGHVSNAGFETDIGRAGAQLFRWDVTPAEGAQTAIDARAASAGRRSLRIAFNASTQVEFAHVSQVVPVEPGARYRLSFSFKTEEFRSAASLLVFVADAGPPVVPITTSSVAPAGTSDWQRVSFDVAAGPKTEGLLIRITRVPCAEGTCPIYGKIWYDDFHLERTGGRANAR
ncbi:MAG TPA: tetratricopeptide repeat protein [Pyrinomonadaceae bacterium]|nr:tetratricopeptide repeat protein [Pyrinomonadaceae bacterium]